MRVLYITVATPTNTNIPWSVPSSTGCCIVTLSLPILKLVPGGFSHTRPNSRAAHPCTQGSFKIRCDYVLEKITSLSSSQTAC
jgi:hypothetical protein